MLGTIHKRRWHFFRIFYTPLPPLRRFLVLSVCKFDQFLTPSPFLIADFVYGRPLIRLQCLCETVCDAATFPSLYLHSITNLYLLALVSGRP